MNFFSDYLLRLFWGHNQTLKIITENSDRVHSTINMCTTYNSFQLWDNHLTINHHSGFGHFLRKVTRAIERVGVGPLHKCFFTIKKHQLESDVRVVTLYSKNIKS